MSLFDTSPVAGPRRTKETPLAERMRPRTIAEFAGQQHLLGEGKPLRLAIERDDASSMIGRCKNKWRILQLRPPERQPVRR